jgi:hypothetical protein
MNERVGHCWLLVGEIVVLCPPDARQHHYKCYGEDKCAFVLHVDSFRMSCELRRSYLMYQCPAIDRPRRSVANPGNGVDDER